MTDKELIDSAIRDDPSCWFESENCKIWPKDRSKGLITPTQNHLQRLITRVALKFEELGLPIRIIGLKPRQKGSTVGFSALDYYYMRKRPTSACVIGGQYDQTVSLWSMLKTYNENDRFNWGNSGAINEANGKWTNGSVLRKETANDKLAGVSDTFQCLHCTETARWSKYGVSDAATVLTNIMKCVGLLPNTIIILESTAEGNSGVFYEKYIGAIPADKFLSGEVVPKPGDFVAIFSPWFEFEDSAIKLDEDGKRDVERTLDADTEYAGEQALIDDYGVKGADGILRLGHSVTTHDVWEQLYWRRYAIHEECDRDKDIFDRDYPKSAATAFLKSGNLRFNAAGLAAIRKRMKLRAPRYGLLEESGGRMVFRQTEANECKFIIYEDPTPNRRYIESIDPMTGISQVSGDDPDLHSVLILRDGHWDSTGAWNRPAVVARVVACRWDVDVLAEAAWKLARFYGDSSGCKIAVEMNKDAGITEYLRNKGADLYEREVFNQREQKTTKSFGWLTTPKNRETLVESMARAIREHNSPDDGIDIFDEHMMLECENFVRKDNGFSEAGPGYHDDDVMSCGIGITLIEHATTYFPNRQGDGLPPDLAGLVLPSGGAPSMFS